MRERFELFFRIEETQLLEMTRLSCQPVGKPQLEVISRCDRLVHPQDPHFRWGKGMKTLCLALLRMKLMPLNTHEQPLMQGKPGSTAATLDNLVHKAESMAWLREMLSVGCVDARTRLQGWFERQNSQSNNRLRPIRIFAGRGARSLPLDRLQIFVAGKEATLRQLMVLERELAIELGEDPSPPTSATWKRCDS